MFIIRKKLSPDELNSPGIRYNTVTDTVQVLVDGVWVDNPAADPRTNAGNLLPPRTGSNLRCDAAANMVDKLESLVNYYVSTAEQVSVVSQIIAFIALFLPAIGTVAEVIWTILDGIISLGATTVAAAFTSTVYDHITQYFYCQLDANGQLTESDLDAVLAEIQSLESSVVHGACVLIFGGLGWVGFNNAGASGNVEGDCASFDCGFWPRQWNFCNSADGWTATCGTLTAHGFEMVDNCQGSPSIVYIRKTIAVPVGSAITAIWFWIENDEGNALHVQTYWNGVRQANSTNPARHPFQNVALNLTGTHEMLLIVDYGTTGHRGRIPTVRVYGTGTAPLEGHAESDPPCL